MTYAVIMAGGSGTRFWPKSTQSLPKQFLNLFGDQTMIQDTVSRLEGAIGPESVVVVTNDDYTSIVEEQLPEVNEKFIIGEPVARNTAPCVAAAAAILHNEDPDSVMVVLPADHVIGKPTGFRRVLDLAVETARSENSLVTIGIKPNRPETGYGYIRFDADRVNGPDNEDVYSVKNFTEKPDKETAEQFLSSGDYLWNSGMFIWKTSAILEAIKEYLPEIFILTEELMMSDCSKEDLDEFYTACPSISIDYGIMEKAEKVHVVPGDFEWNDVGSWTAVHELSPKDENGNAAGGALTSIQDSVNNLIHTQSNKLIALVGVENLAVVETDNAILVVNLKEAQGVKKVVEDLRNNPDRERFL
ncbi:mannose-1-phosphate guanylyltransferase [Rhodohalobacter mucosus]|uniref:mannose-1-phosphate guanylyltransferase n=1 Tax=Rhodohalobacter mucosus TaxID=2079485 RepID=A0A316TUE0_9BACT|nr:mannose-1-phosphate guanylyltransferase [Rhodohalobacter mucosus]PWN05944.1 mannose-1-phosphate guanylyltransferase [Rhodohalobacter mucosus]